MREEHAKYKAMEAESNKQMREENEKTRPQRRKDFKVTALPSLMVFFRN